MSKREISELPSFCGADSSLISPLDGSYPDHENDDQYRQFQRDLRDEAMITPLFVRDGSRVIPSQRISQVLFDRVRGFGSLAELPSNVEAIEAALDFAIGQRPFVVISGPTGWGKTHLLECVSTHLAAEFRLRTRTCTAIDWLNGHARIDARTPLILDDAQEAMTGTKQRVKLRLALERRIKSGSPVILAITSDKLTRHHRSLLPSIRGWSQHEISEPSVSDRVVLVDFMCKSERIRLSSSLTRLFAHRMRGTGNTYHGAITRLKTVHSHWTSPEEVLTACGLLDPFFADDSGWDLKEKIWAAGQACSSHFPGRDLCGLCCYAMLTVARLGELEVARFCGIEPSKAREKSLRFRKSMENSTQDVLFYRHFLETAVESLLDS